MKFLQRAAGPLFDHYLAYISGYARLTSLNKKLLRQNFEGWLTAKKRNNYGCWRSRAASSKLSQSLGSVGRWGPFSPRRPFLCLVS